jgi:hypothetical protein
MYVNMASTHRDYQVYTCSHSSLKNEDRFSEAHIATERSELTILGVYDGKDHLLRVIASNNSPLSQPLIRTGHGGANCAGYISKELPRAISQELNQSVGNTSVSAILSTTFKDVDKSIIGAVRKIFRSYLTWPMPRSERQKIIDSKFQQKDVREAVLRAQSGSTALVLVIEDELITVANVGDCRAGASTLLPD